MGYLNGTDAATQTTFGMPVNFKTNKQARMSIDYRGKPVKWWDLTASLSARDVTFNDILSGVPVTAQGIGFGAYLYNQFTFGKWTAECMAHFKNSIPGSPVSTEVGNIYMNMSVSRSLLKDDLTVRLNIDDPFYIYRYNYEIYQPDLHGSSSFRPNSRNATLIVTYNFGRSSNRSTERGDNAPEEARRAQ
jgi:hypothetical protein